jgi:RimJ/RimL family protein N-acetyltransferase
VSRSDPSTAQLSSYAFPVELRVDDLLLRRSTEADVPILGPASRDPAIGPEAGIPAFNDAMLRTLIREQLPDMIARGLLCPYVIVDIDGTILGGLTIHHFDPMRNAVELGYWLFPEARGRGVATRSVTAATEHAFHNGIERVEAHVRIGNIASERVLERAGFMREGVKRRFLRRGDSEKHDATLFARLADD